MCCLFGLIDYQGNFTGKQKSKILSVLSAECEVRGTDATGIAYNHAGHLSIFKRPMPAHRMKWRIPNVTNVVMGHTRMTTQGSEKKNQNNHPFRSEYSHTKFALAHNGVLYNDRILRAERNLPKTHIETDSYVAVQLIDQQCALTFDSLKCMAEQVDGTFVFTVLDEEGNVYFVKGDNPLCLYHYPVSGFYLYASTEEILKKAIRRMRLPKERPIHISMAEGDILRIDAAGGISTSTFAVKQSEYAAWGMDWRRFCYPYSSSTHWHAWQSTAYARDLKAVATAFGYSPEDVDELLDSGFSPDDVEELLYCGEL